MTDKIKVHLTINEIQYLKWNQVYEVLIYLCRFDNKLLRGITDDQNKNLMLQALLSRIVMILPHHSLKLETK